MINFPPLETCCAPAFRMKKAALELMLDGTRNQRQQRLGSVGGEIGGRGWRREVAFRKATKIEIKRNYEAHGEIK